MRARIVQAIVGAIASTVRHLGPIQAHVVVRPTAAPVTAPDSDGTPIRDATLIRIDVNVNR